MTLITAINTQLDLLATTDCITDIMLSIRDTHDILTIDDILHESLEFASEYANLALDNLSTDDDQFDLYCFNRLERAYYNTALFFDIMPDSPLLHNLNTDPERSDF